MVSFSQKSTKCLKIGSFTINQVRWTTCWSNKMHSFERLVCWRERFIVQIW